MAAGGPFERPGPAGTDLVGEVRQQAAAAQQAEYARVQEAQQAELDRKAKARRRTIIISITMILVAIALAIAGKLAFDAYRVNGAMQTAYAQMQKGDPDALTVAVASIERALDIDDGNVEARGTMAVIRGLQALDGTGDLAAVEAAIAEAEPCPELSIANAIVAILRNEYAEATAAIDGIALSGSNEDALRRIVAWVKAEVALHELDDPAALASAIKTVETALADAPGWDRTYRSAAALYVETGQVDKAFEQITKGRELGPGDVGLAIDEALYNALLHRELKTADAMAEQLLEGAEGTPPLGEYDAARAKLTRAIAALRRDPDEDAQSKLKKAYDGLLPRDRRGRAIAVTVALTSGSPKLATDWLEDEQLSDTSKKIYGAWLDFATDKVPKSLKALAELPQSDPRVALVQGLALVEQGRFKEAKTWLERADAAFAGRPFLDVAKARVQTSEDAAKGLELLEKLTEDYPYVQRGWTGVAEAHVAADKLGDVPEAAEKALKKALKREAAPAQAAYLMGRLRQDQGLDEPKKVSEAIDLLHQAVKGRDWSKTYKETLGVYLADYGSRDEARTLLTDTADAPTTKGSTLLLLAELAAEHAAADKKLAPSEVGTWLGMAPQRGATPNEVSKTSARIALMAGTPEGVVQARGWISPLVKADPKDLDARLIYIDVLRREGNFSEARASVLTGTRKTKDKLEGRLLLAAAEIERDAGKDRQAASNAYKGWRLVVKEPRPANELLDAAELAIESWQAVKNDSGARSIGKGVTRYVPYRAEAWLLRSGAQLKEEPAKACTSASKAIKIDDSLPEAHIALSDCKLKQRDRKGARKALEKAAEVTKDERKAKSLRRRAKKLR